MANTEQPKYVVLDNPNDLDHTKPSRAKFMFRLFFLGFFVFMGGCSYALWSHGYRTTADQPVPESTSYKPVYK
jgi:hypothetical protein